MSTPPTLLETFTNTQAGARGEAQLKDQLSADCCAWYEAATNVFLEGTPEGDIIRSTVPTTYTPPSNPPMSLETNTATSNRLEWQVVGVDADYDHSVSVNLVGQTIGGFASGQTVNLRVKSANPAGTTYSTVKTVTTL